MVVVRVFIQLGVRWSVWLNVTVSTVDDADGVGLFELLRDGFSSEGERVAVMEKSYVSVAVASVADIRTVIVPLDAIDDTEGEGE
jgi:hypothetical protein